MSSHSIPLMTSSGEWLEYLFFQAQRRFEAFCRFAPAQSQEEDDRLELARRVEYLAADLLRERGYSVSLTSHKAAWDIQANGARVEVKAARYYQNGKGGRYQARLHNEAELLLLACCSDSQVIAWYVIPLKEIQAKNIAIWSQDPAEYAGQWSSYLEAWDVAEETISRAGAHPYQLRLL